MKSGTKKEDDLKLENENRRLTTRLAELEDENRTLKTPKPAPASPTPAPVKDKKTALEEFFDGDDD